MWFTNIWRPVMKGKTWSSLCDESVYFLLMHEIKYVCMNTFPNVLERLNLLRFIGIDLFFLPNSFVTWC